ncbi:MAG: DUF814 domain-containing protein [Acidobacteria bacterium]|nr:DUF814 domain-containing protein [Acidobacteriota bacterium]
MTLLELLCLWGETRARANGRRVSGVLPVGRHGVHLVLDGLDEGLRFDTVPGGGAVAWLAERPERVRGGRGAWPDAVAWADREWTGATLEALEFCARPAALRARLAGDAGALVLALDRAGGRLAFPRGSDERALVAGRGVSDAASLAFHAEPAALLEDLQRGLARAGAAHDAAGRARALLEEAPWFPPGAARAWSGSPEGFAAAVATLARRLAGEALPYLLPGGGETRPSCAQALAAWYVEASAAHEEDLARRAVTAPARRELDRLRRALGAIGREEARAPDLAALRRLADALLAAGPAACLDEAGAWRVPDPWEPGAWLAAPADPPGAAPHAVAQRLYARARKHERGRAAREARQRELARRAAQVERVLALAERGGAAELAAAESELRVLGIAAGRALERVAAPGRDAGESEPARLLRSPGGFEVLVGRSARQNDELTFRVAAPDDLWFHVRGHAGAHVVLRTGGRRDVPREDQAFAAALAAAWSQVPRGEPVDVDVARRKHLRRPRGGAPGLVLVRKSTVLRVVAGPPPIG